MANQIIDVDLSAIRKKRFRIDGDNNRIIELNTSDLKILSRLKEAYPKLIELGNKAASGLPQEDDADLTDLTGENVAKVVNVVDEIDKEMRHLIDYIFDSEIADICAPSGSMYDPISGMFRYEHIIATLSNLYETDINSEINQIASKVKKHTSKYSKRK